MTRVLILSNAPTPNNDALFAHVGRQPGIALKVIYCAWSEPHRRWKLADDKGYEYDVAPGVSLGGNHLNPLIARAIAHFRPHVAVLTGSYTMPTFHLAVRALMSRDIPWAYWGEELSMAPMVRPASVLRNRMRAVLRRAQMVFAIGSRAVESYASLGIPRDRIVDFRYYADTEHFRLADRAASDARASVRAEWGVAATTPVFLYCGQFIARKDVETLLRSASLLTQRGRPLHVVLVGSGEREDSLRAFTRSLCLDPQVTFTGFVQPDVLPRQFAAADALVLPSMQEGWGLVVPEALAAGLPVIACDRVNSAADLVVSGESGFHFPHGDAWALASAMIALSDALATSPAMREHARNAVAMETPVSAAARLVTLLERVMALEAPRYA